MALRKPHDTPGGVSDVHYDYPGDERPAPAQPLPPTSSGLLVLCVGDGDWRASRFRGERPRRGAASLR